MNQDSAFVISQFTNPSGEIVFRVSGWLDGKRIRKNFSIRAEAEAERQILEVQRLQGETGVRTAITRLTEDQLQDAEAAFRRLGEHPRQSLLFYLEYALTNYRAPEREHTLATAITEYLSMKERERDRGLISTSQTGSIKKELVLLQAHFPRGNVADLKVAALTSFCERGRPSLKTYNNRRGILGTFFKFAFQKDWIVANPIEKIPYHRIAHRRGSAKTLTAEQAHDLMVYVEKNYTEAIPFFVLCLFAGIRPCVRGGEILKLKPEHINLDTGVIHVEPEVSKVRMKRNVAIQPNLAAWLHAYPLEQYPIIPANFQHLRANIAKKFNLTHDVMRHTFISMFVAKFRSMGEAALQAGNSESIIRKHYLDLKTTKEAEAFFGIMPKRVSGVVTAKPTAVVTMNSAAEVSVAA